MTPLPPFQPITLRRLTAEFQSYLPNGDPYQLEITRSVNGGEQFYCRTRALDAQNQPLFSWRLSKSLKANALDAVAKENGLTQAGWSKICQDHTPLAPQLCDQFKALQAFARSTHQPKA